MYYIAICDDSKEDISYLKGILQEAKGKRNIKFKIFEYISGEELVRNLDGHIHYDLLILDMQLGGMDGDETARLFRERFPDSVLVFCSGIRQPSIKSFKATPFRYLLKTQKYEDLVKTMKEILDEIERTLDEPFLMGHYRWTTQKIRLKNILYIEKAKRGGRIVLCQECGEIGCYEKILVDKKPEELLKELEKFGFALAQNAYLVNLDHIEVMYANDFIFDNGEILTIARAYKKSFKEAFAKRYSDKYI